MAAHLERMVAHRPWPLPAAPYIAVMRWNDVLFAHWRIAPERLRALVPAPLPLDVHDGSGWVGIVPFDMMVRPRGVPPLSRLSRFPEINLRTYVTLDGKPGVYFFSLDVPNVAAVVGARIAYHLNYFLARIEMQRARGAHGLTVSYASRRRGGKAEFRGRYGPQSDEVHEDDKLPLERFLTERYCLYAVDSGHRVWRAEIHHLPWPLQRGWADIEHNTLAAAAGIELGEEPPMLHYARSRDVLVWPPQRVHQADAARFETVSP